MAHPHAVLPKAARTREPVFYTARMVRARNAANPSKWPRYETVYGELLVSPSPAVPHNWIADQLLFELMLYLRREPLGVAMSSPSDISWGRRDTTVQPDMFVIPADVWAATERNPVWRSITQLLLAAEIISPRTRKADRFTKRRLYQAQGVELYWAIDPKRRLAEVWTKDAELPQVERERLVWAPAGAGEPFVFDLARRFAEFDAP